MRPVKQEDKRVIAGEWLTRLPIAIKRVLVALNQLIVAQPQRCECSQLTQLGWDGTCEASRQVTVIEWVVDSFTNYNQASFSHHTHPSAGCCPIRLL